MLCLVIGIILADYLKLDFNIALYSTIGLIILLGIYRAILNQKINHKPYFAVLAYLCMVGIGINAYNIQNEKLAPNHYTNLNKDNVLSLVFKIEERLKPDTHNNKYIVSITSINNKKASGKLLINIKQDSLYTNFTVDALLYTSATLHKIQKSLNPHQFDYSKYLKLKQVYHQLYLNEDELLLLSNSKTSIYGYADEL